MNKELANHEKLLMTEYIIPLSKEKGFISTRPISSIGSIERIENYYENYVLLYKKINPEKTKALSKIVYRNGEIPPNYSPEEVIKYNKEFGNAFVILVNYHCLATYIQDEAAEKLNSWATEFKQANESKNKELIRQIMKKQSSDEDFQNGVFRHMEICRRQNKMIEWLKE